MVKRKSFDDLDIAPQTGQHVKVNRLKSTRGMLVTPEMFAARRAGKHGTITGAISGHGGDYWFVFHDDNKSAAYSTQELSPVVYPPAFIKKVKAAFPKDTELHQDLGLGSDMVGWRLDQYSNTTFEAKEVLKYIKAKQTQQLGKEALRRLRLRKLYGEWQKVWEKMVNQ